MTPSSPLQARDPSSTNQVSVTSFKSNTTMEVVVASSSTDAGIGCWDLQNGAEQLRYKSCSSPPHGLVFVANRFLASSQLQDSSSSSSSSGFVLYWALHKPQPELKSFPAEPIKPLVSNSEGTYLIGGGSSGNIYLWEVLTGKLLKTWHAHYRAVTCLTLSDDESLLISGAEDGCVRVWSLFMVFDDVRREESRYPYVHSFLEHTLRVTDVKSGHGGSNAVIISASEDRTCKVWSLATGRLLRNIVFPAIIDSIAIEAGESVFYAGGRDGKIYIAALNAPTTTYTSSGDYGMHIISSLADQGSKSVTSLAFCGDGVSLASGSEDGLIRIWDTRTRNIIRMLRHGKGPVTNILVIRSPEILSKAQASVGRRNSSLLPPKLEKFAKSSDEDVGTTRAFVGSSGNSNPRNVSYLTEYVMNKQIKEMQQQGSAAASEMEAERLKSECKRALQMVQKWKNMYEDLHQFCVKELVDDTQGKCG